MTLQRRASIMQRRADEDDASSCPIRRRRLPICPVLRCALDQIRQRRLDRVIAAQDIDVDDALQRIRADLVHRRQEIAGRARNDKVDAAELLCAAVRGGLEEFWFAHVDGANADDLCAGPCRRDVCGHGLGFLDVAADDAGVRAEGDEGADLGGADGACAASAEDYFVVWEVFCQLGFEGVSTLSSVEVLFVLEG